MTHASALATSFFHLVAVSPQPASCMALPLLQQLPPAASPARLSAHALRWPQEWTPTAAFDEVSGLLATSEATQPSFQRFARVDIGRRGPEDIPLPSCRSASSQAAGLPLSLSALPKCVSSKSAKPPPLQPKPPSPQARVLSSWNRRVIIGGPQSTI